MIPAHPQAAFAGHLSAKGNHVDKVNGSNYRFPFVLDRRPSPRAPYDEVILETDSTVIVPTRGSLFANWLLVVPKSPHLNFAQYRQSTRDPIVELGIVAKHFGCEDLIWFEHGAAERGSTVGCGVDYAHLHLVLRPPFSLDALHHQVTQPQINWAQVSPKVLYRGLDGRSDYYAFGDLSRAYVTSGVNLGSQFFRKAIAAIIGRPLEWDYRTHAGLEHVQQTLTNLSRSPMVAAA